MSRQKDERISAACKRRTFDLTMSFAHAVC